MHLLNHIKKKINTSCKYNNKFPTFPYFCHEQIVNSGHFTWERGWTDEIYYFFHLTVSKIQHTQSQGDV